jgi:hypothetical protein
LEWFLVLISMRFPMTAQERADRLKMAEAAMPGYLGKYAAMIPAVRLDAPDLADTMAAAVEIACAS